MCGFNSIGFHTDLILNRLRNATQLRELNAADEKKEDRGDQSKPGNQDKTDTADEREYINHRLRQISAWEKRISGGDKK